MKIKLPQEPKYGDTRIIRNKFLWLPKTINEELRWLEIASWAETYRGSMYLDWRPTTWLSEKQIKDMLKEW